jgi:hypothetical protein
VRSLYFLLELTPALATVNSLKKLILMLTVL